MELQSLLSAKEKELEALLAQIERELEAAPGGYIRVSYKHNCPQYYFLKDRAERNGKYLNANQRALVDTILQRDYNKKLKREVMKQLKAVNNCRKAYAPEKLAAVFERLPASRRSGFIPKVFTPQKYAEIWQRATFTTKGFVDGASFLLTARGEKVRSKSEIIIADTLLRLKIPYRYEAAVRIGKKLFFPDFYCLNVRTREEFLWEHLGLLEDPDYAANAVGKIKLYEQCGYKIGKKLILSAETGEQPLNSQEVEVIAQAYLL